MKKIWAPRPGAARPSARTALRRCPGELPDAASRRDALADLERRHRF
ncbi:MAG TPA: hypothetical protein VLA14_12545 [Polyangia bacterium]|nr:hypothetical protein [Polyangia bacterium]